MEIRIPAFTAYTGATVLQGASGGYSGTAPGVSPREEEKKDTVSISREAHALERTYATREDKLEEKYASEADQLERDFQQEKARLQQEYEQKKQSLGISIVV